MYLCMLVGDGLFWLSLSVVCKTVVIENQEGDGELKNFVCWIVGYILGKSCVGGLLRVEKFDQNCVLRSLEF